MQKCVTNTTNQPISDDERDCPANSQSHTAEARDIARA